MEQKDFYEVKGETLILHLPEELDHHTVERVRETTDQLFLAKRIRDVVFDYKNTYFMDSSGIGVVMGRYKQMSYVGGAVYVYGIGKNVDRIFQMSGLYKLVKQWNQAEVE